SGLLFFLFCSCSWQFRFLAGFWRESSGCCKTAQPTWHMGFSDWLERQFTGRGWCLCCPTLLSRWRQSAVGFARALHFLSPALLLDTFSSEARGGGRLCFSQRSQFCYSSIVFGFLFFPYWTFIMSR